MLCYKVREDFESVEGVFGWIFALERILQLVLDVHSSSSMIQVSTLIITRFVVKTSREGFSPQHL